MVWEGETDLVYKKFLKRLNKYSTFIIIFFVTILIKLIYFQVLKGDYFYTLSVENSANLYVEEAPRGNIYDCNQKVLCENRPSVTVMFYPFLYQKNHELQEDLADRAEKILPGSKSKILSAYKTTKAVQLGNDVPRDVMFKFLEQGINFQGISVNTEQRRYYPYGNLASQLIGYIAEINQDELDDIQQKGYKQGDKIGKIGLEKQYDTYIRGINGGWLIETDATGRQMNILRHIIPKPGNDLYLTIDVELQQIAEKALEETGCNGAIVGLDPTDGSVKILVSLPTFNPNSFISNSTERLRYMKDKNIPLYNRTIQAQYAPGSVFKIITAITLLDTKSVDTEKKFTCPGYFNLGRRTFKCWKKEGHGRMNFHEGVRNSCDVYFYNVGLITGVDPIIKHAEKFALGSPTGIDLPFEKSGFLPTSSWREKKFGKNWQKGDTVNIAIGQGYIDVTPLQLASLIASVASRGKIYKPYVVKKIISPEGKIIYEHEQEKIKEVKLPEDVWSNLESAIVDVVDSGTGQAAHIPGVKIAGKTGTAENPHGKDHAWFVCYLPVEKPKLALVVLVEHGGMGGAVAAPVAGKILKYIVDKSSSSFVASVKN